MNRKAIAFAASNSSRSINKMLVTYASGLLRDAEVEILDLNDYELPLFGVDLEDELGQPEPAQTFLRKIGECDGLVISLAEHNGAYSVAYKNLFDWMSRINPKVYQDKPMVLLSTSPGGRGGQSVMELALAQMPRFGGQVRASVSVPSFGDNFDVDAGVVVNVDIAREIETAVNRLFDE